jgi:biotin operon repressor
MTKTELEIRVLVLEALIVDMLETIDCLDHEPETVVVEKPGRKDEVLALLIAHKKISIPQIAKSVGISERNVSSQLSYLRKDGHLIGADSRGWKVYEGFAG